MLVNRFKLLYFSVTIILAIAFTTVKIDIENGFYWIAVAATVELALFLWANWKITREVINYSMFFTVLLYLFHFGQVILLGLFPEATNNQQITLDYFSKADCIDAMIIINWCFAALCVCIIAFSKPKNVYRREYEASILDLDMSLFRKRALLMIGITFPVKFVIDMIFWVIAITQGEKIGVIWLANFPNFITAYGNLSIIGFCLLIISLNKNTQKQLRALIIIVGYFLLLMLSGRRSESVVYICILAFFFIKSYSKKINFGKILLLGAATYLFLTFLFTVVYSRTQVGGQEIGSFVDSFGEVMKERNIFVEGLREYGNTGYTAVCVPAYWLKNYSPTYGVSLIESCTAILPNVGGLPGRLTELGNFAVQLQKYNMLSKLYTNIGGSLIGELLFNFGAIGGVISCGIVGVIVAKINTKSQKLLSEFKYLELVYYVPAMVALLYWIRDVFGGGIRTIVWGVLFVYFTRRLWIGKQSNESVNSY